MKQKTKVFNWFISLYDMIFLLSEDRFMSYNLRADRFSHFSVFTDVLAERGPISENTRPALLV